MPRPDNRGHCTSTRLWPVLISPRAPIGPVAPVVESTAPVLRERLFDCEHFRLWRLYGESPFTSAGGVPRVLVCINGAGQLGHEASTQPVGKGDVLLVPAVVGACPFQPRGPVTLLEVAMPEQP